MIDDVIAHVGWLVIDLASVHLCLCLSGPDGCLYLSGSSVWFFINDTMTENHIINWEVVKILNLDIKNENH